MLRRLLTSSVPPALVTFLVAVGVLVGFDVPVRPLGSYVGYLVGVIAFPGVFAWRALLARLHHGERPPTWFEDLTLGTIFGFTVQLPFYLVGVLLGAPLLYLVLPVVVGIASVTPWGRRVWVLPTGRLHPGSAWAMSLPVLYGLFWLARNRFPLSPLWLPDFRSPNVDETFHQALVSELAHRFPAEIPFLLGVRLDYHWFAHAQIAASNHLTGFTSVEMLRLVMPVVVLALGLLGLGAVALRLTRRGAVAWVAPALLVAGGFHLLGPDFAVATYYEPYLMWRFVSSPSQSYGVMVSMPALMLVLEVLRPRRTPSPALWVALAVALMGLSGAKATFIPVFVCGALGAWGVHLLRTRRIDRTLTILSGLLVAVLLFAQLVVFGGQGGGFAWSPLETVEVALSREGLSATHGSLALMSGAILVGWLLYGFAVVGLRRKVLDPRVLFLLLAVPAGVTVPFLLYRSGLSQLWFSRSTAELVVLASTWGLAHLLSRRTTPARGAGYLAVALLTGAAAFVGNLLVAEVQGTSQATPRTLAATILAPVLLVALFVLVRLVARWWPRLPKPPGVVLAAAVLGVGLSNVLLQGWSYATGEDVQGPRPPDGGKVAFAPGGAEAAAVIADSSPRDAVVATNAHCRKPSLDCDNRHFWISAYTERRILIEGWGYNAVTNASHQPGVSNSRLPAPYPDRLALNDAMFTDPSEDTLDRLVEEYDVSWLFVSRDYDVDTDALFELSRRTGLITREFRNKNYVVYRVTQ